MLVDPENGYRDMSKAGDSPGYGIEDAVFVEIYTDPSCRSINIIILNTMLTSNLVEFLLKSQT